MKSLKKGIPQTITLEQEGLSFNADVKLSIADEYGNFVKDNSNNDLKNLVLEYNSETHLFEVEVTIHENTPPQYIRLYFFGTNQTVINSDYYPQDARLEENAGTVIGSAEIVPIQYFIDYVLASKSKLDAEYEAAVAEYIKDKNGIRSFLMSAQDDLEKDCEIYFTERTLTETRDNYYENFPSNLWQFQVAHPPINQLEDFQIVYGENVVANVNVKLFVYDRILGLIEFLPLPGGESAGLYTLLLENISGIAISILRGGILNRIPQMFKAVYKTGLFTPDADPIEKEGLRKAISRRAFMDLLHIVDPAGRKNSSSESIDGVSASKSFRADQILKTLQEQEKEFVRKIQKKYGKNVNMVIA